MGDRSGDIFLKALEEAGLVYEEVYTTNIVKCCSLNNRTPVEEEKQQCGVWLKRELAIINPKVIVCLGRTAANYFGITDNLNKAILLNYRYGSNCSCDCLVKVLVIVTTKVCRNSLPEYQIEKIEGDLVSYLLERLREKEG